MRRDRCLGLLMLFHAGFWVGFEQLRQALSAIVGEHGSNLELLELVIITLVPISSGLWAVLDRHGLEPSTAAKFSLGSVLLAVSWFCLGMGIEWSGQPGAAGVAVCVALLIVAALCVGPASFKAILELGGRGSPRAWLAVWVLGYLLARGLGSWMRPSVVVETCASVGLLCVVAGVGLALAWRPITSLAEERGRQMWAFPRRLALVMAAVAPNQRARPSGL